MLTRLEIALAVVGVFQRVIFGLQGEREIGGQTDLNRKGDSALDDAVAETRSGRGDLDIGHEGHGERPAVIAYQIDLEFQDCVTETVAVGDEGAGLITVRDGILIAIEDKFEIDRVREAELDRRIGGLEKPRRKTGVIGCGCN